jgi:aminoglycoside phosphotransferase (APT) family kinase protein
MPAIRLTDLEMIARKHGLPPPASLPLPWTGATSRVYPCGDVLVKVACDLPGAAAAVMTDARMTTFVRRLGVRAPELVVFDDDRDIVPVPFAAFRRVRESAPIQVLTGPRRRVTAAWEAVGRDLARVHGVAAGTPVPITLRTFRQSAEVDPRPWVDELRQRETLGPEDAGWLRLLLERLAPAALANVPLRLCHGDVNASNVLVAAPAGTFRALIDWAGAGWLDPAWDFAGVPLDVVPHLLAGHRSVAPLPGDRSAEARILWCQAQTRLHAVRARDDAAARTQIRRDLAQLRSFATAAGL